MDFKTGDIVQLNSGGPDLVVTDIRDDGTLVVAWFAGTVVCYDAFLPATVRKTGEAADARDAIVIRDYWRNLATAAAL